MYSKKPLVSIVMLCWNRKEDVRKGLLNIRKEKYQNRETIVVDNGSSDGTPEMIEKEFPEVKLIKFHENTGIYAYNIGFETAKGKYILILDDDSYPLDDCITLAVEKLEANTQIGCIAAQIVNPKNSIQWPEGNINKSWNTYCFVGCGAFIRKDVFKKVGFYPGKYFLFHNELAVSLRLQNLDYKITYFPEIKCFHKSPPNKRMNGFRMHYLMRNGSWNAWSFMPLKYLVFWYPGFVINNIFLSFKYKAFKGFFKGLFQSYTRLIFYFFKNRSPCYSKEWIEYIKKSFRL